MYLSTALGIKFELAVKQVKASPEPSLIKLGRCHIPKLHTESQRHPPSGSGEEAFKGFYLNGPGGHLGHVTTNICKNFLSHTIWRLHIKFELSWPSGFRKEDV